MAGEPGSEFGRLLRRLRSDAGLTQEALAERAGYSTVYISMLERGRREPAAETVLVLGAALGLSSAQKTALVAARGGTNAGTPELVGREPEQAALEDHLARRGPPVLVLAGEPGIGKSALLRWTSARAVARGARVLEGRAGRGASETNAPVSDALRAGVAGLEPEAAAQYLAGCAWLVRLVPEVAGAGIEPLPAWNVSPEIERRLMFESALRFLENMRDCVLLLDDLHWAGSDALDLLAVIAHAASQSPLRIVAAYRDTDVDRRHPLTSWLADLAHAELVRPLRLGPLAVPAAADLLQQSLGAEGHVPETIRDDLLRRSGGVPFYLVSYAQTVRDHAPETGDVPWSVAQSVRQRVAMLPEGAERTLAALAVAGPADPDLLAHVAGVDPLQAVDVLDTAERGRLVNAIDNQYTFSHDLIREVVEAETTAARRSFLNRRAAEYLEDATGSDRVERLARHYVRGGLNERAIPYLDEAAGRARRRYALSAAAGYLRELVDILVNLGREEEAARAGERLGEVLTIVGRYDEALSVLIGAERRYRDHGVQEGIWRTVALIGRAHAARGSAEEGIGYLQPVLSTRGAQPSGGLARLFTSLARLHFIRGEYPEQLVAGEEAIRHARGVSDDVLLVDAMNVTSVALGMIGRIEESLTAYDEVIRLGTEVGLLEAVRAALGNAAATYLERGQFARGRPYVERALAVAEQIGDPTQVAFLRAMRGELALYSGDRQAARTDLESARDALRHGPRNALAGQTLVNLARLHLEDGVNPTAIGYLKESLLTEELQTQREAQSLLAEIDLKEGRPADAIERLRPLLGREGSEEWDAIPLLALVAEAYLAGGNVDDARVLAAIAVRRARDQGFGLALVDALRVTALIQEASGDVPGALGSLDEAIALTRDMPYPQGEKRLRLQRGRIARVRDDRQ